MPIKKTSYIFLTMFLGLLLAEIAYWLLEIWLIKKVLSTGEPPISYAFLDTHCCLPPYLQFGILAFGLFGGYHLGQAWWRIVYIEHRHWRRRK